MDTAAVEIRLLTWNLFHGRDAPPDRRLFTWRSRLWRRTERNATHVQVNRDLYREFSELIAGADWDVALFQELPSRWSDPLARDCGAEVHRVFTSRNWLLPLTSVLARCNPDLIASSEGGSNAILARRNAGEIVERRHYTLCRIPERRTLAFVRLGSGLCVANIHASQALSKAEAEILRAAETAVEWAAGAPLVLGGDFNVRPFQSDLFDRLAGQFGLRGITATEGIDHLLVGGAETVDAGHAWPPERREVRENGLALRLSDHAPVEALVRIE